MLADATAIAGKIERLRAFLGPWDPATRIASGVADDLLGGEIPARVLAVGKAARALARGAASRWPGVPGFLLETADGAPGPLPRGFERAAGDHPVPGRRSLRATRELYEWLAAGEGTLLALVSGGGSALLCDPPEPWTALEAAALERDLLRGGAAIREINAVRARLSRARAGGLLRHVGTAAVATGVWSDVAPRDWRLTASGPTLPPAGSPDGASLLRRLGLAAPHPLPAAQALPPRAQDRCGVLAHAGLLARDVAARMRREGWHARTVSLPEGTSPEAAAGHLARCVSESARRPAAWVGAGEFPVRVAGGGRGGRCSHLTCAVALALARECGWGFVALATDGVDGDAGGGAALSAGARPPVRALTRALGACDTGTLLGESGHLLPRRPTGNNLRDLWVLFVQ